jgi:hypothetical protein
MVVMLIRSMGTEANFHALVSSQTAHVARSPPPPAGERFHPRAHAAWSAALTLIGIRHLNDPSFRQILNETARRYS